MRMGCLATMMRRRMLMSRMMSSLWSRQASRGREAGDGRQRQCRECAAPASAGVVQGQRQRKQGRTGQAAHARPHPPAFQSLYNSCVAAASPPRLTHPAASACHASLLLQSSLNTLTTSVSRSPAPLTSSRTHVM